MTSAVGKKNLFDDETSQEGDSETNLSKSSTDDTDNEDFIEMSGGN